MKKSMAPIAHTKVMCQAFDANDCIDKIREVILQLFVLLWNSIWRIMYSIGLLFYSFNERVADMQQRNSVEKKNKGLGFSLLETITLGKYFNSN